MGEKHIGRPFQASRRRFLRAAGVGMALPLLDCLPAAGRRSTRGAQESPQRTVWICTTLGIHAPYLFPEQEGRDYGSTRYLDHLSAHRDKLTLYSGLSHPDQAGADGHSSERTWLTAAPHPGLGGFRNSISVDQLAAEELGYATRFPSLILGTSHGSQSFTRSGVMIPAYSQPSKVFADLFLEGTEREVARQIGRLREGRSILDVVADEARSLSNRASAEDRDRLDEYFGSVRNMERRLEEAEAWMARPKPQVEAEPPQDISNESDLIGRMRLMFELVPLALQTDSTRIMSILIQGRNDVPVVDGVSIDHHNLSHHGQDPEKIAQLALIEQAEFAAFGQLLDSLAVKREGAHSLLDRTSVLFGSNLGNANSHDWHNLPILLAGGGFRHGGHVAFDRERNTPLCNLFLTLLQKQGLEIDRFGSSSGTISLGG